MNYGYGIGAGVSAVHATRRRRLTALMAFLLVTGLILIAPPAGAEVDPPVDPPLYENVLEPGESATVEKTILVPEFPLILDVCLLVDLSGSYGNDLPNIRTLAPGLWDDLHAEANLKMGLASFVDYPISPWGSGTDYAYRLDQPLTADKGTWLDAVNDMGTLNGGDPPESQYEALYQIATGCEWRLDAARFVVITTDASFHEPGDPATDGETYPDGWPGASRDDAVDALINADVKVIALKAPGATSQMDDIATATGGVVKPTTSTSSDIASAILLALGEIEYTITADTSGCAPLGIDFGEGLPQDVEAGESIMVDETITVPPGTPLGTYGCSIDFLADGSPIGTQDVTIDVVQTTIDCGEVPGECVAVANDDDVSSATVVAPPGFDKRLGIRPAAVPDCEGDDCVTGYDVLFPDAGEEFVVELTVVASRENSTPPGQAAVFIDGVEITDKCNKTASKSPIPCAKITRIQAGLTQYFVRFKADPSFGFK